MSTILVNVKNKIAKAGNDFIVCGNSDYIVKFVFDEEWDSYSIKTARFVWNETHADVVFEGDECKIPVISGATMCQVGVFAGNLHTTTPALLSCRKSILCEDGTPQTENPDAYSQLMEELNEQNGKAEEYANKARESANRAEQAKEDANTDYSEMLNTTTEIKRTVEDHESRIAKNEKYITNLVLGIPSELFVTDSSVAYAKNVPLNALPYAMLTKVGGMTYKDGAILRSTPVTEVEIVGANLLDSSKVKKYSNEGLTVEYLKDEDCFLINGTATSTRSYATTMVNIPLKQNTLYRIKNVYVSGTVTRQNDTDYAVTHVDYNRTNAQGSNWFPCNMNMSDSESAQNSYTATTLFNFWFYVSKGVSFDNYKMRVMIYEGDTVLPYTAYARNTLPIPTEIQTLDGYGEGINSTGCNYIDFEKRQYIKNVEKTVVDGVNLKVSYVYTLNGIYYAIVDLPKGSINGEKTLKISSFRESQKVEPGNAYITSYGMLLVMVNQDQTIITADAWNAWLTENPVTLVYQLATPEVTDISDILPDDNFIEVEGGGTITMVNEYGYAVPSEIIYQVKGVSV